MNRRARPSLLVAAALFVVSTGLSLAHQLNVFAYVEAGSVVVEAKFSSGKRPVSGEVRILNGNHALLTTMPLGENGILSFPLSTVEHTGGLVIEVETGEGHKDYWILTPEDITRQSGS